jgi:UDP-perosamine 4-acetyltransferase
LEKGEKARMKNSVIVLGAGGHAKVVIEILRAAGHQISYCVGGEDSPKECMGVPVLLGDDHLFKLRDAGYSSIFPAIGSNLVRQRAAIHAVKLGFTLVNAISPYAIVSPSLVIGKGVVIMSGVVINAQCNIEDLVIINTGATIDHDCHIGVGAHVAPQCALAGNVKVGQGVFLGIGTVVIPDITIGSHSIIGAGGVVISDIPPSSTAVGNPAKILIKEPL